MTLDVIGLVGELSRTDSITRYHIFEGFNYEFNTLKENGESNKLAQAFATIFGDLDMEKAKYQPWTVLQTLFPILRALVITHPRSSLFRS